MQMVKVKASSPTQQLQYTHTHARCGHKESIAARAAHRRGPFRLYSRARARQSQLVTRTAAVCVDVCCYTLLI